MKKVLVIGAAGTVGVHTVKYLLSEGKYEITILDLKNKTSYEKLKRFRKRVNILYGDVTDRILIEALVKDHDYIIYLASAMPPLGNMKDGLSMAIDYGGCENVIRAITYYNPNCHLFYASTTSLYKKSINPSVKTKINLDEFDYFEKAKLESEKLIKSKLKNYTIYRIPLVLSDPLKDNFIYQGNKDDIMDIITKEDCAYAFVKGLKYADKINRKTFNLASGETIKYGDLLEKLLKINGVSFKYVLTRIFLEKNYYSPVCSDKDDLEEIIHYRNDSISEYFGRLRSKRTNRKFQKYIAKIWVGKNK